jgi:hypothetical protein
MNYTRKTKDLIIHETLLFLEDKDPSRKQKIRDLLSKMASERNFSIKIKPMSVKIIDMLKAFILNERGYVEGITNLYNSIK